MPEYYPLSNSRPVSADGAVYPGAKAYFYTGGTTTPKDTYTSYTLGTARSNPVVADSGGFFPPIWLGSGRYKVILKTSADVTLWEDDYTEGNLMNVATTNGDMIYYNSSAYQRLAIGTSGYGLVSNGTIPVWSVIVGLASANVFTAAQTFQLSDDTAGVGPTVTLDRLSASPAAADLLGYIPFTGRDSGAGTETYAGIGAEIVDPTAASEDGRGFLSSVIAGTFAKRWYWGAGLYAGTATGGDQGAGTINATGVYVNGTALPFSKSYASTGQTITAAGTLSLAHGLGAAPKLVNFYVKCTDAGGDGGWSLADEIFVDAYPGEVGVNRSLTVERDATNILIYFGSDANTFVATNPSTGATAALDNAKWQLYVLAWA